MSNVLSLLPHSGWQRLLCDALWQSTLIAIVGLLLAKVFTRYSAARASLLFLATTACLIVPFASLLARTSGWAILNNPSTPVENAVAVHKEQPPQIAKNEPQPSDEPTTASPEPLYSKPELIDSYLALNQTQAAPPLNVETLPSESMQNVVPKSDRASIISTITKATQIEPLQIVGFAWLTASSLMFIRLLVGLAATLRLLRTAKPIENPVLLATAVEAVAGWALLALHSCLKAKK